METWKVSSTWKGFFFPKTYTPILKQYVAGDKNISGKPPKSKTELCCQSHNTKIRIRPTKQSATPNKTYKILDENVKVRAWAGGNLTLTQAWFIAVPYWIKATDHHSAHRGESEPPQKSEVSTFSLINRVWHSFQYAFTCQRITRVKVVNRNRPTGDPNFTVK